MNQLSYCMDPAKSKEITDYLNVYLANLNVLASNVRNYHWNIVGENFFEFHEHLGEIYDTLSNYIDQIAEDILMLGFKPIGNLKTSIEISTITEALSENINAAKVSYDLIEDFIETGNLARIIAEMAGDNFDEYTITLLGEQIGFFQKYIWFFNAFLDTPVNPCKFSGKIPHTTLS